MAYDDATPLSFLTVGDLRQLIGEALSVATEPRYVKGLAGLMELFQCSHTQAVRIKASGVIDSAVIQQTERGSFLVDAVRAVFLYRRSRQIIEDRPLHTAAKKHN